MSMLEIYDKEYTNKEFNEIVNEKKIIELHSNQDKLEEDFIILINESLLSKELEGQENLNKEIYKTIKEKLFNKNYKFEKKTESDKISNVNTSVDDLKLDEDKKLDKEVEVDEVHELDEGKKSEESYTDKVNKDISNTSDTSNTSNTSDTSNTSNTSDTSDTSNTSNTSNSFKQSGGIFGLEKLFKSKENKDDGYINDQVTAAREESKKVLENNEEDNIITDFLKIFYEDKDEIFANEKGLQHIISSLDLNIIKKNIEISYIDNIKDFLKENLDIDKNNNNIEILEFLSILDLKNINFDNEQKGGEGFNLGLGLIISKITNLASKISGNKLFKEELIYKIKFLINYYRKGRINLYNDLLKNKTNIINDDVNTRIFFILKNSLYIIVAILYFINKEKNNLIEEYFKSLDKNKLSTKDLTFDITKSNNNKKEQGEEGEEKLEYSFGGKKYKKSKKYYKKQKYKKHKHKITIKKNKNKRSRKK